MSRKHHTHSITHIEIPDCVKRDVILENDPTYAENMLGLKRRFQSGKINSAEYTHLQQWLIESALRRAHVPRSEAPQLVHA